MTSPFSLIGAIWFMYWADYNMSLAVWARASAH